MGLEFTLLSAGPLFKFNPSASFLVAVDSAEAVDEAWKQLSEGGTALMELGSYPFSERYGWTTDKYGLSWQLMYKAGHPIQPSITPTLMFVGEQCGRAEEAINFYTRFFKTRMSMGFCGMKGAKGQTSREPYNTRHSLLRGNHSP